MFIFLMFLSLFVNEIYFIKFLICVKIYIYKSNYKFFVKDVKFSYFLIF